MIKTPLIKSDSLKKERPQEINPEEESKLSFLLD
jgi:hypothetical protein